MVQPDQAAHGSDAAAPAEPAPLSPHDALDMRYRNMALQHLQDRATLNGLVMAILDGSRTGTIEQVDACMRACNLFGQEADKALFCLGAVLVSEGVS